MNIFISCSADIDRSLRKDTAGSILSPALASNVPQRPTMPSVIHLASRHRMSTPLAWRPVTIPLKLYIQICPYIYAIIIKLFGLLQRLRSHV